MTGSNLFSCFLLTSLDVPTFSGVKIGIPLRVLFTRLHSSLLLFNRSSILNKRAVKMVTTRCFCIEKSSVYYERDKQRKIFIIGNFGCLHKNLWAQDSTSHQIWVLWLNKLARSSVEHVKLGLVVAYSYFWCRWLNVSWQGAISSSEYRKHK